jgi:hypothetical protein
MASVRKLKRDVDFLVEEVLSDSYLTLFFHTEKKEEVVGIMQNAVDLRNDLYAKINHPAEKKNRSLIRKHYAQVRRDMFDGIDGLFVKLSDMNKK